MKKVLVLLVGLGLVISCDKEEALDDSSNTFDTTSIMALIESGNNNTSRDVNRPGSVLDFINTIEIYVRVSTSFVRLSTPKAYQLDLE